MSTEAEEDMTDGGEIGKLLEALSETVEAVQGIEKRVKTTSDNLDKERKRDRTFLIAVAAVALLGFLGAAFGITGVYIATRNTKDVCEVANRNSDTIRGVIEDLSKRSEETDKLFTPEQQIVRREQREETRRIVEARTQPIEC